MDAWTMNEYRRLTGLSKKDVVEILDHIGFDPEIDNHSDVLNFILSATSWPTANKMILIRRFGVSSLLAMMQVAQPATVYAGLPVSMLKGLRALRGEQ